MLSTESRGRAAVAEMKGTAHSFYEDRYRLLTNAVPLVAEAGRGEVIAVFDGVGSAPMGMRAAQHMADSLIDFFQFPDQWEPDDADFVRLLKKANREIFDWGFMDDTDRPLGAAPGTVAWLRDGGMLLAHCGDTEALMRRAADGVVVDLLEDVERTNTVVDYFGKGPSLELIVREFEIEDGDRILLFSDGVRKSVPPSSIEGGMASDLIEEGVKSIGERAAANHAPDDVTAVMIEVDLNATF